MNNTKTQRNLALGKPAMQSSTSVWSRSPSVTEDARGGNNGQITGNFGFHTEREQDPWWQVDLLEFHTVREVRIFNRQHMAERMRHFSLLFSLDGENWTVVFAKRDAQVFGKDALAPYVISFAKGRPTRYMRLRLDGHNVLHLSEVEAYGDRAEPGFLSNADADPSGKTDAFGTYAGPLADLTLIQTSDAHNYAEMLFTTSRTVRAYCLKHGLKYEAYIGIKRGFYPYQATFNRIYMLRELVVRRHSGWVLYMDADAFIADLAFDIHEFMLPYVDKAFLATPSGASDQPWDVNAGVFLINLAHPAGLAILNQWQDAYEAADEARLRECSQWYTGLDDQQMLHEILKGLPDHASVCAHLPWALINSPTATFIRQHLRAMHDDMDSRLIAIRAEVDCILKALPAR